MLNHAVVKNHCIRRGTSDALSLYMPFCSLYTLVSKRKAAALQQSRRETKSNKPLSDGDVAAYLQNKNTRRI